MDRGPRYTRARAWAALYAGLFGPPTDPDDDAASSPADAAEAGDGDEPFEGEGNIGRPKD